MVDIATPTSALSGASGLMGELDAAGLEKARPKEFTPEAPPEAGGGVLRSPLQASYEYAAAPDKDFGAMKAPPQPALTSQSRRLDLSRPAQLSSAALESEAPSVDSRAGYEGHAFASDLPVDSDENVIAALRDALPAFSYDEGQEEDMVAKARQRLRERKQKEREAELLEQEAKNRRQKQMEAQHQERVRRLEEDRRRQRARNRSKDAQRPSAEDEQRQKDERQQQQERLAAEEHKKVQARLRAKKSREQRERAEQEEREAEEKRRVQAEAEKKAARAQILAKKRLVEQKKAAEQQKAEAESLEAMEKDYENDISQDKKADELRRRAQDRVRQKVEAQKRAEEESRARHEQEAKNREEQAVREAQEVAERRERAARRAAERRRKEREEEEKARVEKEEAERLAKERKMKYKNPQLIAELKAREPSPMPLAEEHRRRKRHERKEEVDKLTRYGQAKEREARERESGEQSRPGPPGRPPPLPSSARASPSRAASEKAARGRGAAAGEATASARSHSLEPLSPAANEAGPEAGGGPRRTSVTFAGEDEEDGMAGDAQGFSEAEEEAEEGDELQSARAPVLEALPEPVLQESAPEHDMNEEEMEVQNEGEEDVGAQNALEEEEEDEGDEEENEEEDQEDMEEEDQATAGLPHTRTIAGLPKLSAELDDIDDQAPDDVEEAAAYSPDAAHVAREQISPRDAEDQPGVIEHLISPSAQKIMGSSGRQAGLAESTTVHHLLTPGAGAAPSDAMIAAVEANDLAAFEMAADCWTTTHNDADEEEEEEEAEDDAAEDHVACATAAAGTTTSTGEAACAEEDDVAMDPAEEDDVAMDPAAVEAAASDAHDDHCELEEAAARSGENHLGLEATPAGAADDDVGLDEAGNESEAADEDEDEEAGNAGEECNDDEDEIFAAGNAGEECNDDEEEIFAADSQNSDAAGPLDDDMPGSEADDMEAGVYGNDEDCGLDLVVEGRGLLSEAAEDSRSPAAHSEASPASVRAADGVLWPASTVHPRSPLPGELPGESVLTMEVAQELSDVQACEEPLADLDEHCVAANEDAVAASAESSAEVDAVSAEIEELRVRARDAFTRAGADGSLLTTMHALFARALIQASQTERAATDGDPLPAGAAQEVVSEGAPEAADACVEAGQEVRQSPNSSDLKVETELAAADVDGAAAVLSPNEADCADASPASSAGASLDNSGLLAGGGKFGSRASAKRTLNARELAAEDAVMGPEEPNGDALHVISDEVDHDELPAEDPAVDPEEFAGQAADEPATMEHAVEPAEIAGNDLCAADDVGGDGEASGELPAEHDEGLAGQSLPAHDVGSFEEAAGDHAAADDAAIDPHEIAESDLHDDVDGDGQAAGEPATEIVGHEPHDADDVGGDAELGGDPGHPDEGGEPEAEDASAQPAETIDHGLHDAESVDRNIEAAGELATEDVVDPKDDVNAEAAVELAAEDATKTMGDSLHFADAVNGDGAPAREPAAQSAVVEPTLVLDSHPVADDLCENAEDVGKPAVKEHVIEPDEIIGQAVSKLPEEVPCKVPLTDEVLGCRAVAACEVPSARGPGASPAASRARSSSERPPYRRAKAPPAIVTEELPASDDEYDDESTARASEFEVTSAQAPQAEETIYQLPLSSSGAAEITATPGRMRAASPALPPRAASPARPPRAASPAPLPRAASPALPPRAASPARPPRAESPAPSSRAGLASPAPAHRRAGSPALRASASLRRNAADAVPSWQAERPVDAGVMSSASQPTLQPSPAAAVRHPLSKPVAEGGSSSSRPASSDLRGQPSEEPLASRLPPSRPPSQPTSQPDPPSALPPSRLPAPKRRDAASRSSSRPPSQPPAQQVPAGADPLGALAAVRQPAAEKPARTDRPAKRGEAPPNSAGASHGKRSHSSEPLRTAHSAEPTVNRAMDPLQVPKHRAHGGRSQSQLQRGSQPAMAGVRNSASPAPVLPPQPGWAAPGEDAALSLTLTMKQRADKVEADQRASAKDREDSLLRMLENRQQGMIEKQQQRLRAAMI